MAVTVTVEGTDRTAKLYSPEPFRYSDVLNSRSALQIAFTDPIGGWYPSDGEEVAVFDGAVKMFAGYLQEPDHEVIGLQGQRIVRCSGVDYGAACDRHLVAQVYENQTLQQIVGDIGTNILTAEGITYSGVETGPTFEKVVANYITVSQLFNDLAELSGMHWFVDVNKDLNFRARESLQAPAALSPEPGTGYLLTLRQRFNRERYRNKQYVRAGTTLTDSRVESFAGDGTRKTFLLAYPVGKVPSSMTVNTVSKTIGIRGVETGKDWYWNLGLHEISQDDGASALTSSDTLAVTYQGQYPILVQSQLDNEITARIASEGGSGIYEAIDDRPNINDADVALETASALLARYGSIAEVLELTTTVASLRAGYLLPVTLPALGINGLYLIESVDGSPAIDGGTMIYRVRLLSGESFGGWQAFFRKIAQMGRSFVIRENEVLLLARAAIDAVVCGDSITVASAAPESRAGYAMAGYAEAA